jgi:hypothetical protein
MEEPLVLHRNHAPQLPKKFGKPPVVRPEWNTELSRADLDQVDELLAIIAAHKEIGVIGASVMFSFFKRRIQPIQQRHTLGFECIGAEDPTRMCAEELTDDTALIWVRRVLLDVGAVIFKHSQKKTEKLKAVMSGYQELAAKEKLIYEEKTKNI